MKLRKRYLSWLSAIVLPVVLLAVVQAARGYRQQTAIGRIEELGGRAVTTRGEPAWLRRLLGGRSLRMFEQATLVNLSDTEVDDRELLLLRSLNGLQRLNLRETRITDNGLRHLEQLTGLKALDVSGTRISGRGLQYLRRLTALEYLYLGRTQVGDADLPHLGELPSLRHLDVAETAVSREGAAKIERQLPGVDVVW